MRPFVRHKPTAVTVASRTMKPMRFPPAWLMSFSLPGVAACRNAGMGGRQGGSDCARVSWFPQAEARSRIPEQDKAPQ